MQAMNQKNSETWPLSIAEIEVALAQFGLGAPTKAEKVAGGLSHQLLRVETESGAFALKVLSCRAVANRELRARLERAESVAFLAAQNGVPALAARRGNDQKCLQNIGENWVLLYDWRNGEVLPPTAVSVAKAARIGAILGRLHALAIRFPHQNAPLPEAFAPGHLENLAARGERENAGWSEAIARELPRLVEANSRAMESQLALQNGWVTGHLDFDQKNVLWDGEIPLVLDWESAKAIHPALELVGAGLSWAGQSAGDAKREVFAAFLGGYRSENAVETADLRLACEGVLGKWLIWLEFNLSRSLESEIRGTSEEKICHDALFHALGATLQLQNDIPKYRDWVELERNS